MAVLAFRKFFGEIPKEAPWMLPDGAAQESIFCDHLQGFLAPVKDGLLLKALTNAGGTIKGLYTEDGINFFTWLSETVAFRGPIASDSFNRVYYLTPSEGVFRVTTTPDASRANGGSPATNYRVGVPKATNAPVLTLVDRTTLLDYPLAAFTFTAWWEHNGTRYNQATVAPLSTVSAYRSYTFATPAAGGAPEEAKLVMQATLAEGTKQLFTINSSDGATVPGRTSALPGGVEMTLRKTASGYTVDFLWGVVATYAYVFTCTNLWAEESQPSAAALISPTYLQDVLITVTQPSFTGYRPFSDFNIYRTFGSSPNYVRITKALVSGLQYRDETRGNSDIGPALRSMDWEAPPTGFEGIELTSDGWFIAYKGNTVYMSEPNRPHAWPYSKAFSSAIRGVKAGKRFVVITTAKDTHIMVGTHPASASYDKLEIPQAGIANRLMANIEGAVAFASADGIVTVAGGRGSLDLSRQLFDREDWQDRYASSLGTAGFRFAYHDGFLAAFSDLVGRPGFLVRLEGEEGSTFTQLPFKIDAAFYLPVADALYYTVGNAVYEFGAGSGYLGQANWTSKEHRLPKHESFSVLRVRKGAGALTMYLYSGDGVVRALNTFNSAAGEYTVRLPSTVRHERWYVEIAASCELYEAYYAGDPKELQSV